MPKLCFKRRKNGHTVQLVRHTYSPDIQRSKTLTLGALPLDADPNDFLPSLKLRPGVILADHDHSEIRQWLLRHGDRKAAERRGRAAELIEARVRAQVLAEVTATSGDVLERAVSALGAAAQSLPNLVAHSTAAGEDAWVSLRPRYLKLYKAWGNLLKLAQEAGIAKKTQRGPRKIRQE